MAASPTSPEHGPATAPKLLFLGDLLAPEDFQESDFFRSPSDAPGDGFAAHRTPHLTPHPQVLRSPYGQQDDVKTLHEHPLLHAVASYVELNTECVKWREKHMDYVMFDLSANLSLTDLFSQRRREGVLCLAASCACAWALGRCPGVVRETQSFV